MPVEVPTIDDLNDLAVKVALLKDKVDEMILPQEVKDALLVLANWMVSELGGT